MFEQEIAAYEKLRQEYQTEVSDRMNHKEWMEYNEVLFSTHSCAIEEAIESGTHTMVAAARWHGYFIYLHPFRDGNGRTGRLMSNFILMKAQHPLVIIPIEKRNEYISALKAIRQEGTDEFLIAFFFHTAMERMKEERSQNSISSILVLNIN